MASDLKKEDVLNWDDASWDEAAWVSPASNQTLDVASKRVST